MNFTAEAKHRNASNLRVPFLGGFIPAMQMEIDTPRVILDWWFFYYAAGLWIVMHIFVSFSKDLKCLSAKHTTMFLFYMARNKTYIDWFRIIRSHFCVIIAYSVCFLVLLHHGYRLYLLLIGCSSIHGLCVVVRLGVLYVFVQLTPFIALCDKTWLSFIECTLSCVNGPSSSPFVSLSLF